jgi:hypothetical protein
MLTKCKCGAVILKFHSDIVQCKICSSVYDRKGNLLSSRHNWNVEEYFNAIVYKIELDQNKKHQHLNQLL